MTPEGEQEARIWAAEYGRGTWFGEFIKALDDERAKAEDWRTRSEELSENAEKLGRALDAERAKVAALRDLLAGKDKLLVAYRIGSQRQGDTALTIIEKASKKLVALDATTKEE